MRRALTSVVLMTVILNPACVVYDPLFGGGSSSSSGRTPAPPDSEASTGQHGTSAGQRADAIPRPAGPAAFLQAEAERYRAEKNFVAAAASLERAMQIDPGNPWLSLALARVRLDEGQAQQSETFAQRALSKSGNDHELKSQCWETISQARRVSGDEPGANEAARMASQYQ